MQTKLTLPASIGRHIASTFYVTYSNTGNVAMPALCSCWSRRSPMMCRCSRSTRAGGLGFLDQPRPQGYSNTVEILASGKVPGILGPGESVTVPVYYAGMVMPWNFNESQFKFDIRYFTATDATPIDWSSMQASLEPSSIPAAPGLRFSTISSRNWEQPPAVTCSCWTAKPPIWASWAKMSQM